jgi:hypothetical protein
MSAYTLDYNTDISLANLFRTHEPQVLCVAGASPPHWQDLRINEVFLKLLTRGYSLTKDKATSQTISRGAHESDRLESYAWTRIRTEIDEASRLREDWDSYGARPISKATVARAFSVVEKCQAAGALPCWTAPTSDESILLLARMLDGREFKFEIDDEDIVGLEIRAVDGSYSYLDVSVDSLMIFLLGA